MCERCLRSLKIHYPILRDALKQSLVDSLDSIKNGDNPEGKIAPHAILRASSDITTSAARAMIKSNDDKFPLPVNRMQTQMVHNELMGFVQGLMEKVHDIDVLIAAVAELQDTLLQGHFEAVEEAIHKGAHDEEGSDDQVSTPESLPSEISDFLSGLNGGN